MTYDELVTKIRNYTETTSTVIDTTIVNDFISDAEYRIMTDVDLDVFRQNDYSSLTAGTPFVSLPTGILIIRYVTTYPEASPQTRTYLMQKDISFMDEYSGTRITQGTPKYYANWDETKMFISPTPDTALNVEVAYVRRPTASAGTALASTNTTTYLSLNAPNTLTYACLVEAFAFLANDRMYQLYEQKYQQSLTGLGIEQQGRRNRDEYMNGVIREILNAPRTRAQEEINGKCSMYKF